MRTDFLCISVLRVALGPRVKLASCKSALTPPPPPTVVYSTDRSKAVVPVLVLLFGALWFILRDDLLYVLPCAILFLCFSVLLALRLPHLGKRELILVLFVCLIDLCFWICRFPLPLDVCEGGAVCDCGTPWTFLLPFCGLVVVLRPSSFHTDCSKAVPLLPFFFVCGVYSFICGFCSVLIYPHISFFWRLGRIVLHVCDISGV